MVSCEILWRIADKMGRAIEEQSVHFFSECGQGLLHLLILFLFLAADRWVCLFIIMFPK